MTSTLRRWTGVGLLALMHAACSETGGARADGEGQNAGVTIEYIAHAAFVIESSSGARVLIDPYASRIWIGYDWPEGMEVDAILITHPHYDHDAGLREGRPFPWPGEIPVHRDPGRYEVGDIVVHGVEGKHADPYGEEFGQINTMFLLEVDGLRIAHLGDNGPLTDENYRELGFVDVLMAPADAQDHILESHELNAIRERLSPRWFVPMHYRLPDLESDPDGPDDLGPIEPWLTGKGGVVRVGGHLATLRAVDLSADPEILVFEPSPLVERRR